MSVSAFKREKGQEKGRYVLPGLLGAVAVIVGDQFSKWYVFEHYLRVKGEAAGLADWLVTAKHFSAYGYEDFRHAALAPFLNVVMVWNEGVSFGLFGDGNAPLIFVGVSLAICAVMAAWLYNAAHALAASALALIIGGALGNVFDRLRFGAVADFIDVYVKDYHWPAFNVADSAIVIGAGLLILDALKTPVKNGEKEKRGTA